MNVVMSVGGLITNVNVKMITTVVVVKNVTLGVNLVTDGPKTIVTDVSKECGYGQLKEIEPPVDHLVQKITTKTPKTDNVINVTILVGNVLVLKMTNVSTVQPHTI